MRTLLVFVSVILLGMAALATPIAIGVGIYDWVFVDYEFKHALWNGFSLWAKMVVIGLIVGYPMFVVAQSMKD